MAAAWGGLGEKEWRRRYEEKKKKEEEEDRKAAEVIKKANQAAKEKREREQQEAQEKKLAADQAAKASTAALAAPAAPVVTLTRKLPVEFSAWKDADYLAAAAQNEPRLPDALRALKADALGNEERGRLAAKVLAPEYAERRFPKEKKAAGQADLLSKLLGALPAGDSGGAPPKRTGPLAQPVVDACIELLAANRTVVSQMALADLLAGQVPGVATPATQTATIRALSNNISTAHDEILTRFVIALPNDPAPVARTGQAVQGPPLADVLRANTRPDWRAQIVRRLIDPTLPQASAELLAALVRDPLPENVEAQAFLYDEGWPEPALRMKWETAFVQFSSGAIETVLGLSAKPQTSAQQDLAGRIAGLVWNPKFVRAASQRFAQPAPGESLPYALLATLPLSSARAEIAKHLTVRWYDGPQKVSIWDPTSQLVLDPGLIPIFRTAARKLRNSPKLEVDHYVSAATRAKIASTVKTRQQRDSQAYDAWNKAVLAQLQRWCLRMHAAALRDARKEPAESNSPRPIEVHPGAEVVAAMHLDWQKRLRPLAPLATADPMELSYVRIEQPAKINKLLAYYRRQVKAADGHPLANGAWLEGFGETETGRKRSIDVFITSQRPDPLSMADQDQPVVVEVMVIDVDAAAVSEP